MSGSKRRNRGRAMVKNTPQNGLQCPPLNDLSLDGVVTTVQNLNAAVYLIDRISPAIFELAQPHLKLVCPITWEIRHDPLHDSSRFWLTPAPLLVEDVSPNLGWLLLRGDPPCLRWYFTSLRPNAIKSPIYSETPLETFIKDLPLNWWQILYPRFDSPNTTVELVRLI